MKVRKIFYIICLILTLTLPSCRSEKRPVTKKALGTICTVNLFEDGSRGLYSQIFRRLSEIDSRFSVSKKNSDISKINDAAGLHPVNVHEDVAEVLRYALEIAEKSGGAFDPSIGPLVRLWGINTPHAKVPTEQEIQTARSLIDYRKVHLDGNMVFLEEKGMSLDFGGIAKGYAADEIAEILRKNSVSRAVLDLGGNVYVYGRKNDGSPWQIGIRNPYGTSDNPAMVLSLEESMSVVTSGVYERFFTRDGNLYHHILDPKTGAPAQRDFLSVTIVDNSSMRADALSTTAFLVGMEKYSVTFTSPAVFINGDMSVIASKELEGKISPADGWDMSIDFFGN